MKRPLIALFFCVLVALALMFSAVRPAHAGDNDASPSIAAVVEDAATTSAAAEYCEKKGGEVDIRIPYFNTNDDNPQNWLKLSGQRAFCKFTLKSDGSRIHVLLSTLYSKQPSLAALAYYSKTP